MILLKKRPRNSFVVCTALISATLCLHSCADAPPTNVPTVVPEVKPDTLATSEVQVTTAVLKEPSSEHLLVKLFRDADETKYDTVVHYSFLEKDLFPLATFNYPAIQNKSENENSITLFDDSLSVRITRQKFEASAHQLAYKKYAGDDNQYLSKIDGQEIFGTDGGEPNYEIANIQITQNGKAFSLPKSEFKNLFEPNFMHADVYRTNDGRIILWMINSDGAGGYYVIWILKEGRVQKRFTGMGF